MNKETIKELALANGFKLKEQPDGTMDLNPYVFEFAAALERVATAELKAQVEQLQEKIFELQCFDVDVIRCLKTMAFDHNHADILSYQKLAKKCMDRISAENKANEIKAEAVKEFLNSIMRSENLNKSCKEHISGMYIAGNQNIAPTGPRW